MSITNLNKKIMKTNLTLILTFILFPLFTFPQAAGNWSLNQSKEETISFDYGGAYKAKAIYDGDYKATPYYSYDVLTGDSIIILETNILMNIKADSYLAYFGITQVNEKIETCHELINSRINTFIENLKKLGISKNDIYVDFISQVPLFEIEVEKKLFSKTYNEIPKGFEVKKNLHIKYNDINIAEQLLIEAAKNEIYDIIKVDYVINNVEAVYDTLRQKGLANLNKKINELKKSGIKIDPMYQTIGETIYSTYPLERYASYKAFKSSSLSGITKGAPSATVNNSSLYYNKMPYNTYDVVINPEIIQPVVQFTYTVKTQFTLKKQ